jgi:uncharacterized protein (DUF2384 family)
MPGARKTKGSAKIRSRKTIRKGKATRSRAATVTLRHLAAQADEGEPRRHTPRLFGHARKRSSAYLPSDTLAVEIVNVAVPGGMRLVEAFRSGEPALIAVDQVADAFGMSKGQLAETTGLSTETLYRPVRASAPKTQVRVQEMLEIIGRVVDWAGGKEQAMAWYRAEPIPSFGGRTAEALVKQGKAAAVRDYLDQVALGGFA